MGVLPTDYYDTPPEPPIQPEGIPMPPPRPLATAPAPVQAVPLPPKRPEDFQALAPEPDEPTPSASVADSYQLSPDHPVAQLLTGFEHAVSGGVKWLSDTLGFTNSGVQTGGGVRALASGQHAFTDEEHDAVLKSIDPDGKLTPGIRNIMGMNAVYEYYLTHGQKDKAQEMAAGMLEYSKQYLQKSADAALGAPNPIAGGKILAQGINQVPGAPQFEVDDNGNFIQKDPVTGKVVNGGRINPQQLLAIATGAKNGTLFWQSLSKYAHSDDKADEKQTAQQKNLQDAADRRERFDKVMGFVPPDADKPAPGAVPVSGAGTPAAAGEPEESDNGDASTEGRSASAGVPTQGVPTTPTTTAAIPKGVNKPAAQSAYVNMSPILDDEIAKNPEARKIWNEMSNPERQDARMVHNARVARALEQAKIKQTKNAPDPDANKSDITTAAKADKAVNDAWDAFVTAADGKKNDKGEVFKAENIPAADIEGFKSVARGIVQKEGGSPADALDTARGLVGSAAKQTIPTKKDDNGKTTVDWDKWDNTKPYVTKTVKGQLYVIPRNQDGIPDPREATRITYKGLNTLDKMTRAAVQNKFEAQQKAAEPGILGRIMPGIRTAGEAIAPYTAPLPASPTSPAYIQDQARRRELLGLGQ
jgi:hypothetical protein